MSAWDWLFILLVPAADTSPMTKALNGLNSQLQAMQSVPQLRRMNEMSSPTPDLRSIDQSVIDDWAANINAATTALQAIVAKGNLNPADLSLMNQALGNLDGVAGTSTPPVPTPPVAAAEQE